MPSTKTNRPATSGSTLQEMSFTNVHGGIFFTSRIVTIVASPARNVGRPSGQLRPDATSSTIAVAAMPPAASRPPSDNMGTCMFREMSPARSARCMNRRVKNVIRTDRTDAIPNSASHLPSDGICAPYTTRLAGFEIGSTKLAALAMKAQTKRYGRGLAFARAAAA